MRSQVRLRLPGTDPRRRFRNRLLLGMVGVALLPLLAFAGLAALELDAVSRSTAEATQTAILHDQQAIQQTAATGTARLLDQRGDNLGNDLATFAGQVEQHLSATPDTSQLIPGLSTFGSAAYLGGAADPSTLLLATPAASGAGRFAAATYAVANAAPGDQLSTALNSLRHRYQEITAVWIADQETGLLRSWPGFDLAVATSAGRLEPIFSHPQAASNVFTTSVTRGSAWVDADARANRSSAAQYWTDPYPLLGTGITGLTAWVPLTDGKTIVGKVAADILINGFIDNALASAPAPPAPPGEYGMMLSSSSVVLFAGQGIDKEFGIPSDAAGTKLHATGDRTFNVALSSTERAGQGALLQTRLSGVEKDLLTAPVYAGRWLWVRTVPVSALEPELTSLTLGVTAGVHQLFPVMVLPVLLLLVGLAFVAATLLTRRMVLPVQALTDHAVLEERTRLAREIHDTLAQQLTGIVLELEAADVLIERDSDRGRHAVEVARNLARAALQEARRSVWNLRPAPLAATGVVAAIGQEIESWRERTGIATHFRTRSVHLRPPLQPAAEVAVLRVVQEALTNVARHSSATVVDVTLRQQDSELVLTVHDNGIGFDPMRDHPRRDCFGLDSMRERTNHAGGTLTVVSSPGNGTTVTARLPLSEALAVADTA